MATDCVKSNDGTARVIKQKYDVNRWRQYDKVRFNTLLEGFGSDTPVDTTAALDGTGVYEQVANDEYISDIVRRVSEILREVLFACKI